MKRHASVLILLAVIVCECMPTATFSIDPPAGNVVAWQKKHETPNRVLMPCSYDISKSNGHIYLGVAEVAVVENGHEIVLWVWELDADGNKIRELLIHRSKTKVKYPRQHFIPCLHLLPNGDIVLVAALDGKSKSVIKINSQGNIVFTKQLNKVKGAATLCKNIIPTENGNFFILGNERDVFLLKMNTEGKVLFNKDYSFDKNTTCFNGIRLNNDRYAICGCSWDRKSKSYYAWLATIGATGEVIKKVDFAVKGLPVWGYKIARLQQDNIAFIYPANTGGSIVHGISLRIKVYDNDLKEISDFDLSASGDLIKKYYINTIEDGFLLVGDRSISQSSLYKVRIDQEGKGIVSRTDYNEGSPYGLSINNSKAIVIGGTPYYKNVTTPQEKGIQVSAFDLLK